MRGWPPDAHCAAGAAVGGGARAPPARAFSVFRVLGPSADSLGKDGSRRVPDVAFLLRHEAVM